MLFHLRALTLRRLCPESMAAWFGQPANLVVFTLGSLAHHCLRRKKPKPPGITLPTSPNCSIAKAQRLLAYQPRYSSLQGVQEAAQWLIKQEYAHLGLTRYCECFLSSF